MYNQKKQQDKSYILTLDRRNKEEVEHLQENPKQNLNWPLLEEDNNEEETHLLKFSLIT